MAGVVACPSCGEAEDLRGESVDGIQVTCLSCNTQWMRGGSRCAGCGSQDIVHRPQAMTRHSRGTQLSIIGWRELPLCRACDADALEMSISQNTPVPSDYVAARLGSAGAGSTKTPTPHAAPTALPPAPDPAPATTAKPAAIAKSSSELPTRQRPQPSRPKAAPSPSAVPTVRQAIAVFLDPAGHGMEAFTRPYGSDPASELNGGTEEVPGAAAAIAG